MQGVNTSEAIVGLVMMLIWFVSFMAAVFNPSWQLSFFQGIYSIWVGSYVQEIGSKYQVKDMVIGKWGKKK